MIQWLLRRPRVDLVDVQGNILHAYGSAHRYAHYIFVHVEEGHAPSGRRWLLELCDSVTNSERWRAGQRPQQTLNVAVTCAGLRALGVPKRIVDSFPTEFREGMAAPPRAQLLGDTGESDPSKWEDGWDPPAGPDSPHLLVTITARDPQLGRRRFEAIRNRIAEGPGLRLLDSHLEAELFRHPHLERTDAREHFGFADGFSQPAIRGKAGQKTRRGMGTVLRHGRWAMVSPGEFVLGYRGEDREFPAAPEAPLGRNGSFMVVRKLEQHVARFTGYLREKAMQDLPCLRHLPGPSDDAPIIARRQRFLAAMVVGRWHDGTSLILNPEGKRVSKEAMHLGQINRFGYRGDPDGLRCPLGSHVRRANPRDAFGWQGRLTRRHRIIRRGMPYGDPAFRPQKDDHAPHGLFDPLFEQSEEASKERGLMFVCFQASIARQFEVVQGHWLNDGDAFWLGEDRDFLTIGPQGGDAGGRMTIQGQGWGNDSGRMPQPSFLTPQPSFVTTRGGEYFFAPGLSALRALGAAYWL